jgi:RNA polymerase sigma-70 factor, ECF subfamily
VDQGDVTQMLSDASAGRAGALDRLYPLVYDELRRLAQAALGGERSGHTLQATALVHEAYLKLVDQTRARWHDRAHFFAIAAQAIRRILVDHARGRARQKRGGGWERLDVDALLNLPAGAPATGLLALEEALAKLAAAQPEKARVVEMRFFAGLTADEIAEVLQVTSRTVERHWHFARAWLYRELCGNG